MPTLLCIGLTSLAISVQNDAHSQNVAFKSLAGHRPALIQAARPIARVAPTEVLHLALAFSIRDQAALAELIHRLYTPGDPMERDYLSTQAFTSRFCPTEADYAAVIAYATANGLKVEHMHTNRLVLDVSGSASSVERAFGTRLFLYATADGATVRGPETDPIVPAAIASRLNAIVGLDNTAVRHPHHKKAGHFGKRVQQRPPVTPPGYSPAAIKTAYGLAGTTLTGSGQTLGLFELDGYSASDIAAYEAQFSLPTVPLANVLVDGASGAAGGGASEVTLDIELMIALAPGVSKIMVYEGPNTNQGTLDTYNRIATDNLAKSVSTSWGLDEGSSGSSFLNAEQPIFMQMAAQGQSIFAAAGDLGANDNGRSLSVDDPASQPYVTGVGGTTVTTNGAGAYVSETTWSSGGGGKSAVWPIPSYQSGVISGGSNGSTTMRNVPDVALNADPNNGYAIYFNGWVKYGGTSCAAPLWAAFTALVNQQRANVGMAAIGFLNPTVYPLAAGPNYAANFHDISDGSTNGFYPAVMGLDDATGWGSFIGSTLISTLSGGTGGGGGDPNQLIGNPGFENGSSAAPWVASSRVISGLTSQPAHAGTWKAWLGGRGAIHTDTLMQQVVVPANITKAALSFWMRIDSTETSRRAEDVIKIQIRDANGVVMKTLATYSNLNATKGYVQKSFDMLAFKGHTIQVYIVGTENSTRVTSFGLDDFALNIE